MRELARTFLEADIYLCCEQSSKAYAMQCRHHGTTFFPDFQHQQHASDFMYFTFSLPHPNHDPAFQEAESGQLVIDRSLSPGQHL